MTPKERERARASLEAWFEVAARDLPWRHSRDPYAVWVSEVMLQQTRVETVLRYFGRFLARFPTARALAEADEGDVLALWSGLGYYRRARALHRGAKAVLERHGGIVPRDAEARLALPGVGRYTAGAIGSLAFGLPEPIVDGNVRRVLSRVHRIGGAASEREREARLWEEASAWADGPHPGRVNEALMELGATLCSRSSPRCGECPLARFCEAREADEVDAFPPERARRAVRELTLVAIVARDPSGRVLLVKADSLGSIGGSLYGGLWTVPMAVGATKAAARALAEIAGASLGPARARTVEHVLTHRRLRVKLYAASFARAPSDAQAVSIEALDALGISSLTRKILAASTGPFTRK